MVSAQRGIDSENVYDQTQVMPSIRPTESAAMFWKAVGVKSRLVTSQPVQRSVTVTSTEAPPSTNTSSVQFFIAKHLQTHR